MKNTVTTFQAMKDKGEKISMLTAYDYSTAKLEDAAGINGILVGDSLGNVVLGYDTTIPVTVEDMIHHGAAVARGAKNSLVVVDMPFLSYQTSVYDAVVNAGKIMKETQCDCVKLEGGKSVCPQIKAITDASIPVMAHIGLTPQSVNAFGGFKVQGKTLEAAQQLIEDAKAVEEAGADGISMINTLVGMRFDIHSGKPIIANKTGGYSGPAIFPVALRMVYQVSQAVNIPVIGMGGISTGRDAIEMMIAGASAVQVGCANLVDPYACPRIIQEMNDELDAMGIENITDIIGKSHQYK